MYFNPFCYHFCILLSQHQFLLPTQNHMPRLSQIQNVLSNTHTPKTCPQEACGWDPYRINQTFKKCFLYNILNFLSLFLLHLNRKISSSNRPSPVVVFTNSHSTCHHLNFINPHFKYTNRAQYRQAVQDNNPWITPFWRKIVNIGTFTRRAFLSMPSVRNSVQCDRPYVSNNAVA